MAYLHYFEITYREVMHTQGYITLSENGYLQPGNHTMTTATKAEAKLIAHDHGYTFVDGTKEPKPAPKVEKKEPVKGSHGMNISKKCLDDARRIQGKAPFNNFGNFCYGDGYFAQSCIQKYGEKMWNAANDIVRSE